MHNLKNFKNTKITVEEIGNMNLGFIVGKTYNVYGNKARDKDKPIMMNGMYIGESGMDNDFLIFKSKAHGVCETFLKKDILFRFYNVTEV